MKLLRPSPLPQPTSIHFAGFPSPADVLHGIVLLNPTAVSRSPEITQNVSERIHVAVGKSLDKSVGLLNWTFREFQGRDISLVHVHQPSVTIPTLLGKLPVSQANEELVLAHRREERERTQKILLTYLNICNRAKVQAKILVTETGQVQKGIVDLVAAYGIRKLVMGGVPVNCMKVKRRSTKADYTAKNAPPFCEIWFVNRGKLIWTREAFEIPTSQPPLVSSDEIPLSERLKYKSSHESNSEPAYNPDFLGSCSSVSGRHCESGNELCTESEKSEALVSSIESSLICTNDCFDLPNPTSSTSSVSGLTSPAERWISSEKSKEEQELENLYNQLIEARTEVETSKKEAFEELLKRKRLESEAAEAFTRVKAFEAAGARETELRKEVEDAIRTTKQEQENISKQRDEAMKELQKTMRTVAILDSHAREAARRRDEATGELKLIQASIATLRLERQKMRRQREESVRQLEHWRKRGQIRRPNYDGFSGMPEFTEFSLMDLQTATFNFSESLKIGQGGYGCVYKGEMLDRSVAIKKLHPHNMQGPSEFQQEVQILSKLHHPHLMTLIGACPEACSLVYDYLPNGSLQDRLFCKTSAPPLNWKTRARIAAEISSALLFLHSSKPEKIVHGDLKPENIFLDSKFNCKIGDFGISRLVPEENVNYRTFHRNTEPKSAFPYLDPEFQRTGDLTPKSDVYSFGIIILQLVTGKPPVGLVGEVRRAVLAGKLCTVLDPSAGEWHTFVARRLVEMALQCSEMNNRDRPELTPEVVKELEQLRIVEERPVPAFFLCPILKEIMHDPQVAADGFTYEGEALRGWLENGRETSPMTNLKLAHLDLTPNYALRSSLMKKLVASFAVAILLIPDHCPHLMYGVIILCVL